MRVVSLFAGIGGIDLGLERAGMTTVAQVENDPWCIEVLEKHWPTVPRWTDIHDVDPKELPDHELIAGGFPCQPVSVAGTRQGQDDPRWLWPEFARIVRVVRPRYVFVENVPGLASAGMGDVLGDLAQVGYDAEWQSIPAAFVGAPHLRWRLFIVAYATGERRSSSGAEPRSVEATRLGKTGSGNRRGTDAAHSDGDSEPGCTVDAGSRSGELVLADPGGVRRDEPVDAQGRFDRQARGPTLTPGEQRTDRTQRLADSPRPRRIFGEHPSQPTDQWAVESDVGRVADGVSRRVDRLRGLGNAVVPQVAEFVGRLIMEDAAR